jgi:hypothetical protein
MPEIKNHENTHQEIPKITEKKIIPSEPEDRRLKTPISKQKKPHAKGRGEAASNFKKFFSKNSNSVAEKVRNFDDLQREIEESDNFKFATNFGTKNKPGQY